ncbi:MAG: SCO family protein [Flavobacteriaceae bacterium]|nr:SCO family protein [Bacteroidia bacterium]NNL16993.1 SCO family protein [Flavobacteriaceae bacterium]
MKKSNYSYIGISFIILVFGIIFIPRIIERLQSGDIARNKRISKDNVEDNRVKTEEKLTFLEINGNPKKVPEFSFIDQYGKSITNNDYFGKVYVVEFFFTTCPTICPRMNANMVDIQNHFNEFNEDFGIASFTINPKYDTPEVLKAYADKYGVTNPNWHFLTGDQESIYVLANQGFNIYAGQNDEVEGGFEHSGNFALIDKNGYIRSRMDAFGNPKIFYKGIVSEAEKVDEDGEKEEISMLKEDIKKLLDE